ncbi:MAG: anthranilate phosphoribosyltransferase [Planctomycetaceae bacterium]|jgi:anthranilate phosphoribosyltransferase|nr:anthranilate phosphoribosyltransferase [Planctomycetaceae bacterium]|tara:strand:- start:749 stop:1756 length:1008 start_codon:yes stop_codon:yes gene_type:complete
MLNEPIAKVESGEDLTQEEMAAAIDLVMQGQCEEEQIRSLLLALVAKGETVPEIAGAASAMRAHMTPLESTRQDLVDTCGTGGDGSGTFNISTAAAIVAAGAGIAVAKHGNRKITSKTGSADVLVELGVNIEAPVDVMQSALNEVGICFCFAPLFHPAMRHVGPVRRSIDVPTIFNLLGPLCNPARAPYQVLGVGKPALRPRLAEALSLLDIKRAYVVCGSDGLDEITLAGNTDVTEVSPGVTSDTQWQPSMFGLAPTELTGMDADNPAESADRIKAILNGATGPGRDIVVINAAAAVSLAKPEWSLTECTSAVQQSIDSGAANDVLRKFGEVTN